MRTNYGDKRFFTMPFILLTLLAAGFAYGGDLDSPDTPAATTSYTLEDIYNRLETGAAGTQSAFTGPTAGPTAGTGRTIDEVMGIAPALDNANGATGADVAAGKTFWGLTDGEWGLRTGTGSLTTAVPKTGQTECYDTGGNLVTCAGTGHDGDIQRGATPPVPRFTDNGDGTVTDNMTGLVWLKDPKCAPFREQWATVVNYVTELNTSGTMAGNNCGDTSNGGTHQTDWRLPTVEEFYTLIDYGEEDPALPAGNPFLNVKLNGQTYWLGTTSAEDTDSAWRLALAAGQAATNGKTVPWHVWPVRGGN